jgi:indolepyruvate ferredoxin oxidoreductase beta subunit
MKQQIVISGIGGQGVLFATRVIAEAAMEEGLPVLTSETHGMAMRGGTVISHVKVGPFQSPLIRPGQADVGLFLHGGNLELHRPFLREGGRLFINRPGPDADGGIDAAKLAADFGHPVIANLILIGHAAARGALFCGPDTLRAVLRRISPPEQLEINRKGFEIGFGLNC